MDYGYSPRRKMFQNNRKTVSVDDNARNYVQQSQDSITNSLNTSLMTMDLHSPDNLGSITVQVLTLVYSRTKSTKTLTPLKIFASFFDEIFSK